jgi:hypothetical protein
VPDVTVSPLPIFTDPNVVVLATGTLSVTTVSDVTAVNPVPAVTLVIPVISTVDPGNPAAPADPVYPNPPDPLYPLDPAYPNAPIEPTYPMVATELRTPEVVIDKPLPIITPPSVAVVAVARLTVPLESTLSPEPITTPPDAVVVAAAREITPAALTPIPEPTETAPTTLLVATGGVPVIFLYDNVTFPVCPATDFTGELLTAADITCPKVAFLVTETFPTVSTTGNTTLFKFVVVDKLGKLEIVGIVNFLSYVIFILLGS